MADKLINISKIYFYTGLTASASDCFLSKKLLDEQGIKYVHLAYNNDEQYKQIYDSLSTWYWGKEKVQKKLDDFPILTWQEKYEGSEDVIVQSVQGFGKIKTCSLLKNKNLIAE